MQRYAKNTIAETMLTRVHHLIVHHLMGLHFTLQLGDYPKHILHCIILNKGFQKKKLHVIFQSQNLNPTYISRDVSISNTKKMYL